jgi:hypothetical protein
VGGFAGYLYDYLTTSINNSAALGLSVTATGAWDSTTEIYRRDAGRFYGTYDGGSAGGNYVKNTMYLYESDIYGNGRPKETRITDDPDDTIAAASKHGKAVSEGTFRQRSFWQNAPGLETNPGMGFKSEHWDFSTIEERGHPVLRASPDGARMGGQQ